MKSIYIQSCFLFALPCQKPPEDGQEVSQVGKDLTLHKPSLSMLMGSQQCCQHAVTKIISALEMILSLVFIAK